MHVLKHPNVDKLHSRLIHGRIDRRQFMQASAAAGLVPVATAMAPGAVRAAAADLTYFTWSGYEVTDLFQSYVDKYGGEPSWSVFASAEDGLQKIRAGFNPDISHPCVDGVPRWVEAGVIQPLDTARIAAWDDMFPSLHTMTGAVVDGDVYMAITDFGLSSIIYRTDIYEGEESWEMLFDERYAGRICPRGGDAIPIYIALKILGYDPMGPTSEQIAEAADMVRKQRPLARFYWESQTDMEQAIASGECVVGYAWNEALVNLTDQGVPVAFAAPKEGAFGWACGLVLGANSAADTQMAYDFIDAWLAPESGKFLIETYGYGHGNQKSFDLVDPARLTALGYDDPVALMNGTSFWVPLTPQIEEEMMRTWDEVQMGL